MKIEYRRLERSRPPQSAKRFLEAFRAGATAAEMDSLLAVVREDYRKMREARIQRDAQIVMTRSRVAASIVAVEVEALINRAKELLESVV